MRYNVNIENVFEKHRILEHDIKEMESDSSNDDIDAMSKGSDLQLFSEHEFPSVKDSDDFAQQTKSSMELNNQQKEANDDNIFTLFTQHHLRNQKGHVIHDCLNMTYLDAVCLSDDK